jgi:hypothetical protein
MRSPVQIANLALSVSLDYVSGTISVDWSKVARLESSQLFVVLGVFS